ncbi:Hpt domain-containing protein [Bdellovibrio bacteriovorus]
MSADNEELNEFFLEARELLDSAEENLLNLDDGQEFNVHYDAIFRALHNLKGSAGIFEQLTLQEHVHLIETAFTQQKEAGTLSPELVDYFLKGCDHARKIIDDPSTASFAMACPDGSGAMFFQHDTAPAAVEETAAAELTLVAPEAPKVEPVKPVQAKTPVAQIHSGDPLKAVVALMFRYYPELDSHFASHGRHEEREVLRFELQALLNSIKKSA